MEIIKQCVPKPSQSCYFFELRLHVKGQLSLTLSAIFFCFIFIKTLKWDTFYTNQARHSQMVACLRNLTQFGDTQYMSRVPYLHSKGATDGNPKNLFDVYWPSIQCRIREADLRMWCFWNSQLVLEARPPSVPKFCFKIMHFSGNFEHRLGSGPPPGVKTPLGPPDNKYA